ncbi:MAG TPA: peroxiredoxin-like family protein [Jiangellaceae bacterium]
MGKIEKGDVLTPRELPTVREQPVRIPDQRNVVHLQFRRYAGCPICNVHLRGFAARHDELASAGVREVVVFHSDAAQLLAYGSDLPFDLVPDPGRALYRDFGVDRSWQSIIHPATWLAAVRGWSRITRLRSGPGGHFGLPADFLIAPSGQVLAARYGRHASDQWSVDEVLLNADRLTAP